MCCSERLHVTTFDEITSFCLERVSNYDKTFFPHGINPFLIEEFDSLAFPMWLMYSVNPFDDSTLSCSKIQELIGSVWIHVILFLLQRVRHEFIKIRMKMDNFIKKMFIKNHFHQNPLSPKTTFIKNHFHQNYFHQIHFHQNPFIKNHFH